VLPRLRDHHHHHQDHKPKLPAGVAPPKVWKRDETKKRHIEIKSEEATKDKKSHDSGYDESHSSDSVDSKGARKRKKKL